MGRVQCIGQVDDEGVEVTIATLREVDWASLSMNFVMIFSPGLLEQAHGGVIYFDEVADMPIGTQSKILRVLVEQEFERVGGVRRVKVDVRIITDSAVTALRDVQTGEGIDTGEEILDWRKQPTGKRSFAVTLKPHAYRAFRLNSDS